MNCFKATESQIHSSGTHSSKMVKTECSSSESGYQSMISPMGSWSTMLSGENSKTEVDNAHSNGGDSNSNANDSKSRAKSTNLTSSGLSDSSSEARLVMDTERKNLAAAKRPRTILNQAQRRRFKEAFETTPKPCRKVIAILSKSDKCVRYS